MAKRQAKTNAFDPNQADQMDQTVVDEGGQSFPFIQWHNGNSQIDPTDSMQYMGGFFCPADQAPADLTEYGWEEAVWRRKSSQTKGYWRPDMEFLVLGPRRRWETQDRVNYGADADIYYGKSAYNSAQAATKANPRLKAVGKLQLLVLLKGAEDLGPFFITGKVSVAQALDRGIKYIPSVKGILNVLDNVTVASANKLSSGSASWPRRAFWVHAGVDADADGEVNFALVGKAPNQSSMSLPVSLSLPAALDTKEQIQAYLNEVFIGKDMMEPVDNHFQDALEWIDAWDSQEGGAATTSGVVAKPAFDAGDVADVLGEASDAAPVNDLLSGL